MSSHLKMIRRWDVFMVLILILISLLPIVVFSYVQKENADEQSKIIAVISVDNEVVDQVTLTDNVGEDTFDITTENGKINTVEVRDETIRVKGATCSDQVCVRSGFISKPGEIIVCIPHKLMIKIETLNGETDGMIISS